MPRNSTYQGMLVEMSRRVFDVTRDLLHIDDPALTIAMGETAGIESIDKFGRNTAIASGVTADIWDGGKTLGALPAGSSLLWIAPTAAATHDITSTSTDDDGAPVGTGARTIRVFGLTDWDTAEVSEDIIMNGTGDVETTNSYVIIHRMEVLTKGASGPNVGTITATAKAPSALTVTARIEVGKGQTQMAVYGIPSTKTAYLRQAYAYSNKASGVTGVVDISLKYNPEPDAELLGFLEKFPIGLITSGTSGLTHTFTSPRKFIGPGILKMQALSGTSSMDITAGFDIDLVDN